MKPIIPGQSLPDYPGPYPAGAAVVPMQPPPIVPDAKHEVAASMVMTSMGNLDEMLDPMKLEQVMRILNNLPFPRLPLPTTPYHSLPL